MNKYHPALKEAYLARELKIREQKEFEYWQKNEEKLKEPPKSSPVPIEMPTKLPVTKSVFNEVTGKMKVRTEDLNITGVEHMGIVHDVCITKDLRVYRLYGDRFTARVLIGPDGATMLDMKEISIRSFG